MPTTDIEDHNDIRLADGVTAYHGSPHEFEEFDPAFIGTGEGAQAYGHGLYFAENEDVARSYRDALSHSSTNAPEALDLDVLGKLRKNELPEVKKEIDKFISGSGYYNDLVSVVKKHGSDDIKNELLKADPGISSRGHMYEVRIDAHPEKHLMDYDKLLTEQPDNVRKAIKSVIDKKYGEGTFEEYLKHGNDFREVYRNFDDIHPKEYSDALSEHGIRGIRYKDAGSRGMDSGSGSHNYVIFDPKHIKTVRRYAEGGGIKAFAIGNSIPHLERASDMIETHDDIQLAPGVEAIDEMPDQAFTSENTSRNQIPALFNSPAFERKRGNRNLDYGGGAFDKGTEYLAKEHGVESHVYDPFNRPKEHNDFVLKGFKKEPADTATVANVLNVIAEPEARLHVIKQVHSHIKPDGKAYFTVYEGDGKDKGSGNSRMTRDGWQEYRPTHSYVEEIKQVFPDVRLSGKTIVASKKPAKAYGGSIIPGPKLTEENADDFARRLIAWTFATAPLFHKASGGSVIDDPLDVISKLRR